MYTVPVLKAGHPSVPSVYICFCLGHLGVWGELASHKRLFNPPSQFSRLGIQVSPLYIFIYSCLYGMVGTEGWVGMDCLSFLFFSFFFLFLFHSTTGVLYTCTFMCIVKEK